MTLGNSPAIAAIGNSPIIGHSILQSVFSEVTTDVTTTSVLPAWAALLKKSVTTGNNKLKIVFTIGARYRPTGPPPVFAPLHFRISVDGAVVSGAAQVGNARMPINGGIIWEGNVTAGPHSVVVEWAIGAAGTAAIQKASDPDSQHANLLIEEIK